MAAGHSSLAATLNYNCLHAASQYRVCLQITSPACTELEVAMMDWLGKLIQLPDEFLNCSDGPGGGVIQVLCSAVRLIDDNVNTHHVCLSKIGFQQHFDYFLFKH
jgi:hypothetical protein